jgi:hypothetical protein
LRSIFKIFRQSITQHWSGNADFVWLILINLLGIRFAVHLVGNLNGSAPIWFWIIQFVMICFITLWQIIGTYRAGKSGMNHPDGIFKIIAMFSVLVAVLITTSWQINDQYERLFGPVTQSYIDPSIIVLPRSKDGKQLYLRGPITLKQYNAFRDLKDFSDLQQVTLDSEGGNVFAARGLYRLIQQRQLNTFVDGRCYSACTIVFISGKARKAALGADFGFHSYAYSYNHTGQVIDVQAAQDKDSLLFKSQGVPQAFVNQIFATPASDLWHPTYEALRANNVLN